jgi:hypothetical protein
MGISRWCFIESKSFELVVEGSSSVLRILERSRGNVLSICFGKVSISWLLATIEALVLEEGSKEFWRRSRVGIPALFAQCCSNKH